MPVGIELLHKTATRGLGSRMAGYKPPPPSYSDIPQDGDGREMPPREKIRLYSSSRERSKFSELSDLYAIIKTTEHLERAFIRNLISDEEYEGACLKLIAQFKAAEHALQAAGSIQSTLIFMEEYLMECPKAKIRLLDEGVPATVMHSKKPQENDAWTAAQTSSDFITAKDQLSLGRNDVDELQPLLANLMQSLNRNTKLPKDDASIMLTKKWLVQLNKMRGAESITEEQNREMFFDLEKSHFSYTDWLKNST